MFRKLVNYIRCLCEVSTGDVFAVENQGRHRAANPYYFAMRGRHGGDPKNTTCYLFTDNELSSAHMRALKNPEDVPWCTSNGCECGDQS